MAQSKTAKIMAILALLAITVSVIGTGILFFMGSSSNQNQKQSITKEQLQEMINKNNIKITSSGTTN